MYVYYNIEERSGNQCCSGKAIDGTYSECVFIALRHKACNAHGPRCHLWPDRHFFRPRQHTNGTIF